jgi:hypothetical protein
MRASTSAKIRPAFLGCSCPNASRHWHRDGMWPVWLPADLGDCRVHARTRRAGVFYRPFGVGRAPTSGRPRVQLQRCEGIDAEAGGDMTEGGRDVGLADSEAWATGVWAVVRRHSEQSWAAGRHVHETFPARLLRRS